MTGHGSIVADDAAMEGTLPAAADGLDPTDALRRVRTRSIHERPHKVGVNDFVDLEAWRRAGARAPPFPRLLKGGEIAAIVGDFAAAHRRGRANLFAVGAHVIKCGLSPILADLMRRGWLSGLALNGAGAIHDLEIALVGGTSEDVARELSSGGFGMVEETPRLFNEAVRRYDGPRAGLGEALGRAILEGDFPFREHSLLAAACSLGIPVTVHVAIGADTVHMHPSTDPGLLGAATYRDFQRLALALRGLHDGGCYWNVGSAVLLPEVFLKALTLCRNTGAKVAGFTAVNLDMQRHYRPELNVVRRPTEDGGAGYTLVGHHEIMIPLLYSLIIDALGQDPTRAARID